MEWSTQSVRPYFERPLEVFGPDRLMYGRDWPVSILDGGYDALGEGSVPLFDELVARDRPAILGGTARRFN